MADRLEAKYRALAELNIPDTWKAWQRAPGGAWVCIAVAATGADAHALKRELVMLAAESKRPGGSEPEYVVTRGNTVALDERSV